MYLKYISVPLKFHISEEAVNLVWYFKTFWLDSPQGQKNKPRKHICVTSVAVYSRNSKTSGSSQGSSHPC